MTNGSTPGAERGMGRTLRDDLSRTDLHRTIRRDFRELRELFLDDHRKELLAGMGRVRRWLYTTGWLLKALFFKLTPARRLLFALAIIFFISSFTIDFDQQGGHLTVRTSVLAAALIVFILMLELKDKLLAQSELEAGRLIQAALQPERTPAVAGWSCWLSTTAANEVGGDLVDVQSVGERHLFSLADVAGKGVRAALVTTRLQATIRALAPESNDLAGLLARINTQMYQTTTRNMFASLVVFDVRPGSGEVRLINAGHLPPIVLRNGKLEELGKGDPAIGIFAETPFHEHTITLERGESILVYSDGVPDAKNEAGEFFSAARLQSLLAGAEGLTPEGLGAKINGAIRAFVKDERLFDDISMVIVRREG
jgi:serine phosphatase RsbU (regulator of sigma subunit)